MDEETTAPFFGLIRSVLRGRQRRRQDGLVLIPVVRTGIPVTDIFMHALELKRQRDYKRAREQEGETGQRRRRSPSPSRRV